MIRVAICEDEKINIVMLQKLLLEYGKDRKIEFDMSYYRSGKRLVESSKEYHIAFLDVDMPDMNGIETGKYLWKTNKKCKIIYITNFKNYREIAQNQIHSFAYLNKPVKKDLLFQQMDDLISNIVIVPEKEFIRFTTIEQGVIEKAPEEVLYFEYNNRKITMHCQNGVYQVKENIGQMAERMEKYDFAMPHQSFLVNLSYVSKIQKYEISLANGVVIPLAQKRSPLFRKMFMEYMQKGGC